mmetsp:Transcript_67253/g.179332  ORF Transcript_67253/g.179332 Transcript_67253/m.179332 type:complete len:100 (-) Transcript_67253:567-866(-)
MNPSLDAYWDADPGDDPVALVGLPRARNDWGGLRPATMVFSRWPRVEKTLRGAVPAADWGRLVTAPPGEMWGKDPPATRAAVPGGSRTWSELVRILWTG